MKHLGAIIIKFVMIAVILEIILMLMTSLSFASILLVSLGVTVLAYLIGDIWILRKTNNIVATISDVILSLVVILLFNLFYRPGISFGAAILSAVIIGIGEYFYHKFIARSFHWEEKKAVS